MTLEELAAEYLTARPGVVLDDEQMLQKIVEATRYYAGYGDIRSISQSDQLPGAPGPGAAYPTPPDDEPAQRAPLPVKLLDQIDGDTVLTVGEWAIVRPLFVLYVELGNATLLEATRGMGQDVFGRSVSEVSQDIALMENETLPAKCFQMPMETIGGDVNPQPLPGTWLFSIGPWT
jgi:hypothetical protein